MFKKNIDKGRITFSRFVKKIQIKYVISTFH